MNVTKKHEKRLEAILKANPNLKDAYISGKVDLEYLPAANIFKFVGKFGHRGYIKKIDPTLKNDPKHTWSAGPKLEIFKDGKKVAA